MTLAQIILDGGWELSWSYYQKLWTAATASSGFSHSVHELNPGNNNQDQISHFANRVMR